MIDRRAAALGLLTSLAVVAACSDDPEGTTTTSATTSTAMGGSGGSGGSVGGNGGSGTQAGGSGGGGAGGMPFTSEGASTYETQTSLAADDDGNILVSWIAFFSDNSSAIGYAVSHDAGESWTAPAYIEAPDGRLSSNPTVAVNDSGQFALAWLGFRVSGNTDEHIYFSLLDGDELGAPTIASDDGTSTTLDFDKPSLAVEGDDFLLTWADFTGNPELVFARTGDGAVFSRTSFASGATFGNLAYLCRDPDAAPGAPLYVVHLSTGATLTLHRSTDGGNSWTALPTTASDVLFQDPTCAVAGNDVWIAYAEGVGFDPFNDTPADAIQLIAATDQGDVMAEPLAVSPPGATDKFLFPRLRRIDGKLVIVHYRGNVNEAVNLGYLVSLDDGLSWTDPTIAAAGTMAVNHTLANWLGAYVGFDATSAGPVVSYADNSSAVGHIAFATFALP